mmetsp:Transcript_10162/g.10242  ORF Transcript_10162/g.10242 Transcript_10162/m.10242 type:complete len:193 (-) Transcript_10162:69-647(-)
MVTIDGQVLTDSWSIAEHTGMPLPEKEMMKFYDDELGPLSRQFIYMILLKECNHNIWYGICTHKKHIIFKIIWYLGLGYIITNMMKKTFKSNDNEVYNKCKQNIKIIFNKIENKINKKQTKYINGNFISVEDICIASLGAPLVLPEQYCEGEYYQWFLKAEKQDKIFSEEMKCFRATPVGKYILDLYSELRL